MSVFIPQIGELEEKYSTLITHGQFKFLGKEGCLPIKFKEVESEKLSAKQLQDYLWLKEKSTHLDKKLSVALNAYVQQHYHTMSYQAMVSSVEFQKSVSYLLLEFSLEEDGLAAIFDTSGNIKIVLQDEVL